MCHDFEFILFSLAYFAWCFNGKINKPAASLHGSCSRNGGCCVYLYFLEIDLLCNVRFKLVDLHTLLLHAVTVADGNAAVIFTVKVIRDAERRADLILAAIALADGTRIVKVNGKLLCERIVNLAGLFAQLLGERQNRCLKRCQCRVQTQYNTHVRFSSVPRFSSS